MTSTTASIPPKTLSLMTEIISYPVLLQHEESFTNANSQQILYDVSSWLLYIAEIDSLLEQMNDATASILKSKRNKGQYNLSTASIGGKEIKLQLEDLCQAKEKMEDVRNLISERALSLLPGSYKIWKNYLDFRSLVYTHSTFSTFMQIQKHQNQGSSDNEKDEIMTASYPIASSASRSKYKSTISAYERSLVRMNKYPRIWLSYIYFVISNHSTSTSSSTSENSVTAVRRLFNRALLALPATQHDMIWNECLCWILDAIPPSGLMAGRGKNLEGPLVQAMKKHGSIENIVYGSTNLDNMDKIDPVGENDDDDDDTITTNSEIPPETILRILRRYAHYYNPTARELLAKVATTLSNYGEAATLYCEILNDVNFLSVEGTSRHELWMKLANVCTEHPEEVCEAGVDFEGIVRSVLKPPSSQGKYGNSGFGWDIVDGESKKKVGDEDDKEEGDDEDAQKRAKVIEQRNQLQASLGEMEGTLWTKLAQFHIRMGEFELARSIYEEAMESVVRVRDFSLIFDGYMKFEEGVIEAMMDMMNEDEEQDDSDGNECDEKDGEDMDILLGDAAVKQKAESLNNEDDENVSADVELALARAENLMSRRPLLLNYVLLRQNPHNVGEWLRRAELYLNVDQSSQAIASLEESVKIVNSRQAVNGSPAELYKTLANIYEEKVKDVRKARSVYERICNPTPEFKFREPDDLAQCYTAWVEMELRSERWDDALSIARRSVAHVPGAIGNKVTKGLVKSMRLWNLLLDLEESLGTLQTTKDAYNRLIEMKVASPAHIINFASYLIEKKYFEECFTAYERGLDMFSFPHPGAKILWKDYLQAFQKRYSGSKIHRMRELCDRCLETCPPEDASEFFILYGKFEEEFGLTKRALGVYERMCTVVPAEEKFVSYQLYIAKTIKYLGITATRSIYENAIAALEDNPAAQICCEFAKMEASLQEIERARAAFTYGAQLADPRRNPEYWGEWHSFEVSHGNEETFREMLRVKRGVQAAFSTVNYNAAEMAAGAPQEKNLTNEEAMEMIAAREGVEDVQNQEKARVSGFVQGKRTAEIKDLDEVERRAAKLRKVTSSFVAASNNNDEAEDNEDDDDEIDIDDEEEEEPDQEDEVVIENKDSRDIKTKAIPSAVFGGLASQLSTTQ